MRAAVALMLMLAAACTPMEKPAMTKPLSPPIVIAHRGASGERPEHTLEAYRLAIAQGADVIEPDLVLTRDDVFVARHENDITGTTDVADRPDLAGRRRTKMIDGREHSGWFTEDFTLAELKTLRARERLPEVRPGSSAYDDRFDIPTLDEVIALAKVESARTGRSIAIYPETKHPSYFASIGHPMEQRLADALAAAGWTSADAPVFIQSFEVENLRRLKTMTGVRLIQLLDASGAPADGAAPSYAAMASPAGLAEIAGYAWGIGPAKAMVLHEDGTPTSLVGDAHAAGLRVHPWTYRAENSFLPPRLRAGSDPAAHGAVEQEMRDALAAGVDGFFTDFPLLGVTVRDSVAPR